MFSRNAFGLSLLGLAAAVAQAQTPPTASGPATRVPPPAVAAAACPAAADLTALHLYGLWRVEFEGIAQTAPVLFEKHSEYPESVSGAIRRGQALAWLAGDVDAGQFTLDESVDRVTISATWTGDVLDGSCGKEIRGTWKNVSDDTSRAFVLRKQPGWQ